MKKIDHRQTETAKKGRNGDKFMAHIAPGEIIVPPVISPELKEALYEEMRAAGIDPAKYEADGGEYSINPETGKPEFFFKKIKKFVRKITSNPIFSMALPFVLGPAGFGLSTLASAGIGAGLGAISGRGLKGIAGGALGAASGGIGNALGGGISSATGLSGAISNALGRGATSAVGARLGGASTSQSLLAGGLSGVGALYQSGAFNNTGQAFREGGLSGALSQFDANTPAPGGALSKVGANAPAPGGGGTSSYVNKSNTTFLPNGEQIKWKNPTQTLSNAGTVGANPSGAASPAGANPSGAASPAVNTGPTFFEKLLPSEGDNMFFNRGLESILSSGVSKRTNDIAERQLVAQQQQGLSDLQPILDRQFDASDLANDSGYQFQLGQGLKALDSANASRGNFYSGDALRSAGEFATGLADNTVNNAYSRFSQTRGQDLQGASLRNDLLGNIGTARAQSTLNKGNAYNQSISNFLNPRSDFESLLGRYLYRGINNGI
jgi:hypothetical protein